MWPLRVEQHMLRHVLYLQQRKKNAFHSYPSLVRENNNTTYTTAELIQYTNMYSIWKCKQFYKI